MENSETHEDIIDISLYLDLIKGRMPFILAIVFLSGLSAFLISKALKPVYEARTILMVSEDVTASTNEYNAVLTSERLARTYAQIIIARPILDSLKEDLGLSHSVDTLRSAIKVDPIPNTQLIEVTVRDYDPNLSAVVANTLVSLFIRQSDAIQEEKFADSKTVLLEQIVEQQRYVDEIQTALNSISEGDEAQAERTRLEQQLSQYRQSHTNLVQTYEEVRLAEAQLTSNIFQIEPATIPTNPVEPKILANTIIAGLISLVAVVGGLVLREALDNSIKNSMDVKTRLGIPVLAMIGRNLNSDSLVAVSDPRSPSSEAFRSLRTNIQFASVDSQLKKIMVTSPIEGEGKTTVAANLAFVMSQLGTETILVDADLRRPKLHKLFELSNKKGLSNLFVNKEIGKVFSSQLQDTRHAHLKVLTSGGIPPNPSELISTTRMINILELASEKAGLVIVDAPPVLPVTDAVILAQKADGVIIVMVPGQTTMPMAKQTVENLRQVKAKILGAVFNNVDLNSAYFSSYKNGYKYLYDHE